MLSALIMPRPAQSTFPQLKIFSAKHRFHGSPKSANNANAPERCAPADFFVIHYNSPFSWPWPGFPTQAP
jgi:hypothetical protein